MDLIEENRMLRERIAVLQDHIHAGINCGHFCALPECAKFLQAGEDDDKVSVGEARTTSVERASCSTGSEPF
jgi:hypothetical protein